MDPFWRTFSEELKARGRDATPFIFTLAGLACLLIAAAIVNEVNESRLVGLIAPGLPWAGAIAVVWAARRVMLAIRRARKRRREHWERHELSCDEWRVARSKLKKDGSPNKL